MKALLNKGNKRAVPKRALPVWVWAFLVNLAVALIGVAPFIIMNDGYMAMSHDFSAQEISFNILMNDTVKSGNLLWNWGIDIGSNFLETFSFYNVGSVFFWMTLLFPAKSASRVMGWMIIFKYAVSGATSAAYLGRHVRNRVIVIFASILYTFSGFACGTVVFYHFQDEVALFPLLLIGMEMLVEEKKKGRLLFACTLNLLCNYVFFVGEVLFLVAYYVVKYLIPSLKTGRKKIGNIVFPILGCMAEGIIGIAIAGVLFIPSINGLLANARISDHLMGNSWFSMSTWDWLLLLKAVLMPAEPMNYMSAVASADWSSNLAYLPMTGLLFVLAYIWGGKRDWISGLLKLSFAFAIVPVLNSVFMFFNAMPYRRWYYMAILIMALASAKVLEEPGKFRIKKAAVCLLVLYGILWGMLNVVKWDAEGSTMIHHKNLFYFGFFTGLGGLLLTLAVVKWGKARRTWIMCVLTALCSSMVLGAIVFKYQATTDNTCLDFKTYGNTYGENVYVYLTEIPGMLDREVLPYRYYFDECIGYTYYNLAMTNTLPSINSFISTLHPSVAEFYDSLGMGRQTWTNAENTGTRELLGARYVISLKEQGEYTFMTELSNSGGQTMYLYENENALPMGFTYDAYITRTEFEQLDESLRPAAMLGVLVVKDEDVEKLGGVLAHCSVEELAAAQERRFSYIADRRQECSSGFVQGKNSFQAQIAVDSGKYAFFSVPYDKFWKAYVNGQEREVLNINGLMAVRIDQGENTVLFEYKYLPLKYGILLSIAGIGMCVFYLIVTGTVRRKSR